MPSRRPLTFYLAHSAATGNLGDDAMLINAACRLRGWFPGCRLRVPLGRGGTLPAGLPEHEVVPDVREWIDRAARATAPLRLRHRWPDRTREDGGPAVEWRRRACEGLARVVGAVDQPVVPGLRALQTSDVLYVTGDNAVNDFNPAGVFARLSLLQIARRRGLTVVLSSQGVGPIESRWAREAFRDMLAAADLVSYRYAGDGAALGRVGPSTLWQAITGDEAFSLEAADARDAERVLARAAVAPRQPFLAVHFRDADFTPDHQDLTAHTAAALDAIAARIDHPFVFLPMSVSRRYGLDAEYGCRIQRAMSAPDRLRIAEVDHPSVVKAMVARARLTLGSSYHLHVFGLSQGVPAVVAYTGSYYAGKSRSLIDLYGPPGCAMDIKEATPSAVADAVDAALENPAQTATRIAAVNAQLVSVNDALLAELARRLTRSQDALKSG